jgi:hypothetical protein
MPLADPVNVDAEPVTGGPMQPTIEFANALMDAYNAEHGRNLELEARIAELERQAAIPQMEAKRVELSRNLSANKPNPATFEPISVLRKRAMRSGPVPTYRRCHQWATEQEPLGFAKTAREAGQTARDGVRMYPPTFDEYIERYRRRDNH